MIRKIGSRITAIVLLASASLGAGTAFAQYPGPTGAVNVVPSVSTPAAGTIVTLNVQALGANGLPLANVSGSAQILSAPGATAATLSDSGDERISFRTQQAVPASVLTPTFVTDGEGRAAVQVQTGSTPGRLVVGVTVRDVTSQVVLNVEGAGSDDGRPGPGTVPRPPDTGQGAGDSGDSTALLTMLGAAAGIIVLGGGSYAVLRRRG